MASARETISEPQLVAVNSDGVLRPLWAVHPIGGSVLWLRRLAEHFPANQPLYGIEARGLTGRADPVDCLTQMAADYVALIRGVQAQGPYLLCGASFGGTVAFEMARQLRAVDEDVALLALFDSFGPGYPSRANTSMRARRLVTRLSALPWKQRFGYVLARLRYRLGGGSVWTSDWTSMLTSDLTDLAKSPMVKAVQRVIAANVRALGRYKPQPIDTALVLFRATERAPEFGDGFEDPTNGWGPLAPAGVDVIPVEGDHRFLLDEPAVGELSRKLAVCVRRAHNDYATQSSRRLAESDDLPRESSDRRASRQ